MNLQKPPRPYPGARCLIIGETRGFESNIGAEVTTVELTTGFQSGKPAWLFKDASRLLLVGSDPDQYWTQVGSSYEDPEFEFVLLEHHLLVISDPPKKEVSSSGLEVTLPEVLSPELVQFHLDATLNYPKQS